MAFQAEGLALSGKTQTQLPVRTCPLAGRGVLTGLRFRCFLSLLVQLWLADLAAEQTRCAGKSSNRLSACSANNHHAALFCRFETRG
jgi:hypothetical protein